MLLLTRLWWPPTSLRPPSPSMGSCLSLTARLSSCGPTTLTTPWSPWWSRPFLRPRPVRELGGLDGTGLASASGSTQVPKGQESAAPLSFFILLLLLLLLLSPPSFSAAAPPPEEDFEKLPPSTVPEMQRTNLAPVILQLKALGIDNVLRFNFLSVSLWSWCWCCCYSYRC